MAAKVLLDRSHTGKTYELTGPASVTFYDLARAVSSALGQEVKYIAVPPEAVAETIRKMGMDEWFVTGMKNYSEAYSRGWGDFTTENVEQLTGHPARSIEQFAKEVFAPALSRN